LGIASRSSLNPGCFRMVGGLFGTWSGALSKLGRGPFRDLVGGPFGTWFCALSGLGFVPFRDLVGVLSEAHRRKRKKQQAKNTKQALRALSFCLVGFAHTKVCTPCRNEAYKKVQGQQPWVLAKRRASQQNKWGSIDESFGLAVERNNTKLQESNVT